MKNLTFWMCVILVFTTVSCDKEEDICEHMDDPNFVEYCYGFFDLNNDGVLSLAEAEAVTEINLTFLPSAFIKSLKGIEYFTNLVKLDCSYQALTSLNVKKCKKLEHLICRNLKFTSLDVSGNPSLKKLECYNNKITSLNVSGCINLDSLLCHSNQLTSLDVSGCSKLEVLHCYGNQLTSLDVSGCTNLKYLYCTYNQLTSLDVSGCPDLEFLFCKNNPLTSITLSTFIPTYNDLVSYPSSIIHFLDIS